MKLLGFRDDGRSFHYPFAVEKYPFEKYDSKVLKGILQYLRASDDGNWVCSELCVDNCHICGDQFLDAGTFMTDGEFVWPLTIRHHIVAHGFQLPDEFIRKMYKKKYICPKVPLASIKPLFEKLLELLSFMDKSLRDG